MLIWDDIEHDELSPEAVELLSLLLHLPQPLRDNVVKLSQDYVQFVLARSTHDPTLQ